MEVGVGSVEASENPDLWIRERNASARVILLQGAVGNARRDEEASRIDSLIGGAHDGSWFARAIAWELALEQNLPLKAAAEAKGMELVVKAIVDQANPVPYETELNMQVWFLEAGDVVKADLLIYRRISPLDGRSVTSRIRLFETSAMDVLPL